MNSLLIIGAVALLVAEAVALRVTSRRYRERISNLEEDHRLYRRFRLGSLDFVVSENWIGISTAADRMSLVPLEVVCCDSYLEVEHCDTYAGRQEFRRSPRQSFFLLLRLSYGHLILVRGSGNNLDQFCIESVELDGDEVCLAPDTFFQVNFEGGTWSIKWRMEILDEGTISDRSDLFRLNQDLALGGGGVVSLLQRRLHAVSAREEGYLKVLRAANELLQQRARRTPATVREMIALAVDEKNGARSRGEAIAAAEYVLRKDIPGARRILGINP